MDKNLEKIKRSIKIRRWMLSVCIGIGFGVMGLDLMITGNFFKHNDTLMLISIFSLGLAIYIDSTVRRLQAKKRKIENELTES